MTADELSASTTDNDDDDDGWDLIRHALERAPLVRIPMRGRDAPRKLNRTELMTLAAALSMALEPTRPTLDRLIELVDVRAEDVLRSLDVLSRHDIFHASYKRGTFPAVGARP